MSLASQRLRCVNNENIPWSPWLEVIQSLAIFISVWNLLKFLFFCGSKIYLSNSPISYLKSVIFAKLRERMEMGVGLGENMQPTL